MSKVPAQWHRIVDVPFAVLATHGPEQRLDLVPCCFAVDDGGEHLELVSAIDHKPKRSQRLARLVNIERDPQVSLLVDHRDPADWLQLWWVRAQGEATIVEEGPAHDSAIDALARKYAQYREVRPTGPVIRIHPDRWAAWPRDDQEVRR